MDPFYSQFKLSCLNFMRSMRTDNKKCIITPVQLISDVTHFLDASFLYGSNKKVERRLRRFNGGLLRSKTINGEQFMPSRIHSNRSCPKNEVCYDAGDDRVNQNLMLAVVQTMFLRFHNHVASQLATINNFWSDSRIYRETRKIVIGIVQHITYTEYLPLIINRELLIKKKLIGSSTLVLDQYDQFLNPGTLVSFTSAAFRAFHSMIPPKIRLFDENRKQVKVFVLSDIFFKPGLIQQNGTFDNLVRGLTFQPAQKMGQAYTDQVTNLLFKSGQKMGLDLVAADVMRGRDHGLPTYNLVRLSCGLNKFTNFTELQSVMSTMAMEMLSKIYNSVEDIDLYIGGLLEFPAPASLVGPVLECILVEQFKRWKDGDIYFYTFLNSGGPFSPDQLKEIVKMTLAKIACLVTNIQSIQPQAFKQPNLSENKLAACSSFSQMDFEPWRVSNG